MSSASAACSATRPTVRGRRRPALADRRQHPKRAGSCDRSADRRWTGPRATRGRCCPAQSCSSARVNPSSGRTSQPPAKVVTRPHACHRAQSAAAQPLQQHRLELIVGVVGGQQQLGRARAARRMRHSARRAPPPPDFRPAPAGRPRARPRRPDRAAPPMQRCARTTRRIRMQAVVDVDGAQRAGPADARSRPAPPAARWNRGRRSRRCSSRKVRPQPRAGHARAPRAAAPAKSSRPRHTAR